jgi:hypothetical protein
MNRDPVFLEGKHRCLHDPHLTPLTALIESWRKEGRLVPWADPDSGGVHSKILFLHESPGPASSSLHGSGMISPDNNDQTAARFWRLSEAAALDRSGYINWNAVPWYVSATGKAVNATPGRREGRAALPALLRQLPEGPAGRRGHGRLRRAVLAALLAPSGQPSGRAHCLAAPQRKRPPQPPGLRAGNSNSDDQGTTRSR